MTGTDKRIKEKNKALQAVNNLGVWLVVLGMFILLSIVSDKFLQKDNLINLIRQIAVTGITALGATFIILSGEIDLSSGSMIALMGCVSAALMMKAGLSVAGSFVLTLLIGALCITVLALAVAKFGVLDLYDRLADAQSAYAQAQQENRTAQEKLSHFDEVL